MRYNHMEDTYTGGEHYWIRFWNGIHEVRKEGYPDCDSETVFTGHYEECMAYLESLRIENVEYDMDI